jgi:hypothetical protein
MPASPEEQCVERRPLRFVQDGRIVGEHETDLMPLHAPQLHTH